MASGSFRLERWWRDVVAGKSPCAWLWRPLLWLMSVPWAVVVCASHLLYHHGMLRARDAELPVVSVGNISVGGTGKTTVCIYLATRLLRAGLQPAIVLRGHRRNSAGGLLVSDGRKVLADPGQAGDEAWLMARELPGCPVAVATRREMAIRLIARQTRAQIVLLDDGFQYYRLARLVDIVLLDAYSPPSAYRLFPLGFLREPLSHLVRATDVWITHADIASAEQVNAVERLAERHTDAPVLTEHAVDRITTWEGTTVGTEQVSGRHVVAVAGLGNPEAFFAMLAEVVGGGMTALAFPDHHAYVPEDWRTVAVAADKHADAIVMTTPKDAVKLPPPPEGLEVFILHPQLRVQREEGAVDELVDRIGKAMPGQSEQSR
jgi:tetraacyldisaccharide 4'-kinase